MRKSNNDYSVYLDGGVGQDPYDPQPLEQALQPAGETPFCLGLVGNFSGLRTTQGKNEASGLCRPPLRRVTPENVLQMAGLTPEILLTGLPDGLPDTAVRFSSMEDFHPDTLYERLDVFRPHRSARERISTGGSTPTPDPEAPGVSGPSATNAEPPPTASVSGSGLLDAVLGETQRELPEEESGIEEDLDAFIRRVVRPHAIGETPDHSQELEELDRQTGTLMTAVLHNPEFRELESLWRSVVFLLSRIEVSTKLRVYLIDVSREELAADLLATEEPAEWGFAHTMLMPRSENGEELRWAALLTAFHFGQDSEDIPLLQRLGLLAESGGIPVFGAGSAPLLGARSLLDQPEPRDWTESLDPLWMELRQRPEADWISLSLPAFLLRAPYDPAGRRSKRFEFREGASFPEDLLWGNPCFLWGVVMAQEFAGLGWELGMNGRHSISQIPLHPTPDGWATSVRVNLSYSAASRVQELGLSRVVNKRNEPEVHLHGMGSISASGHSLKAWWRNPA